MTWLLTLGAIFLLPGAVALASGAIGIASAAADLLTRRCAAAVRFAGIMLAAMAMTAAWGALIVWISHHTIFGQGSVLLTAGVALLASLPVAHALSSLPPDADDVEKLIERPALAAGGLLGSALAVAMLG